VTTAIRQHGVTTDVVWTDSGRQGAYYLEFGTEPRETNVVYDRTDAAVTTVISEELPLDRIEEADAFYTSGITPALSPTLEATTRSLLKTAQATETTTVFDLNYRAKLWPPEAAEETYESILPAIDILIAAERDLRNILNLTGSASTMIDGLQSAYDHDVVIVTRGEEGAIARGGGKLVEQPSYETDTLDPIGTGDAFVGGFLARNLQEVSLAEALDVAAATAALKRTMRGDIAVVTPEEVERIRAGTDIGIDR
jgi:2-dehydro-3-deoxygluconokinase